jgi:hypothetical protein
LTDGVFGDMHDCLHIERDGERQRTDEPNIKHVEWRTNEMS